ncbi:hypothetical protein M8J76_011147 [Diaphorina citri]|nr:hypothetical protein M8J75_014492 [Diaphorina citri]KAI5722624.1 hypothetical protein M8J76_011147 [Diaphorina citri]
MSFLTNESIEIELNRSMNDSELMLSGSESDSSSPSSCDDSDADPSFNPAGDNRRALFGDRSGRAVAHSLSSEDEDDKRSSSSGCS